MTDGGLGWDRRCWRDWRRGWSGSDFGLLHSPLSLHFLACEMGTLPPGAAGDRKGCKVMDPTWHLVQSRHSVLLGAYFSELQGWEGPMQQLKVETDESGNPSALGFESLLCLPLVLCPWAKKLLSLQSPHQ